MRKGSESRLVRLSVEMMLKRIARVTALALCLALPGPASAAVPREEPRPATEGKTLTSNNDEISVFSRDQGLGQGDVVAHRRAPQDGAAGGQ